jgi:hypothetical protein
MKQRSLGIVRHEVTNARIDAHGDVVNTPGHSRPSVSRAQSDRVGSLHRRKRGMPHPILNHSPRALVRHCQTRF